MCASSEEGGVVTNGMSESKEIMKIQMRHLVNVNPSDFGSLHPLGVTYQRNIEQKGISS